MPDPPPLRVGLVGYGLAGAVFHAPLITVTDGLELRAVVTGDPERQAAVARAHPAARPVDDPGELMTPDKLDLLVIASPNRTHVPLARAALEAGLAVVVDKPLAATAAQARELAGLARSRNRLLTVFQNRRWDGDFLTARELVGSGQLGDVHRFESRFDRWRPQIKPGWRESAEPEDAGGVLYDLGSHLIDQALQLFGPVEEVYAERARLRAGAQTEDDVFLALTHAGGVRSHLWMSQCAALPGPRLRILGARGAWSVDGLDPQEDALRSGAQPGAPGWGVRVPDSGRILDADGERPLPTLAGDYLAFYRGVLSALRDGAPPPVAMREVIAALEVIDIAQEQAPLSELEG